MEFPFQRRSLGFRSLTSCTAGCCTAGCCTAFVQIKAEDVVPGMKQIITDVEEGLKNLEEVRMYNIIYHMKQELGSSGAEICDSLYKTQL